MADTDNPSSDPQGASAPVRYEVDGGVATVRLDRPSTMNALDVATKEALLAALQRAAGDDTVRAVVLTGSGRAFCVGQDLREHASLLQQARSAASSGDGEPFQLDDTVRDHYNPIVLLLATMAKPVIAAVNGVAAGAGAAFAFACDVRLVAQSAGFNLAFSAIGLSCDSGSSWSLPRLVGIARAKDLLLFPRTVGADEALGLGLATKVVPDDELPAAAAELAGRLASGPTRSYAAIRDALLFSQNHDLAESLAHEAELMGSTGRTEDHAAAVQSFLAKEPPRFSGR
ncbi:MAG TPA: enoyl-CoA hydratase-related protein [Actinomycetales bacterium]|nr:enoyl-CoA hydratase-related protein [Actinomycetales bacterium]